MARGLTREELQAQLDAERTRNDVMAKKLTALEQDRSFSHEKITAEAIPTKLETFEAWRDEGLARGYGHPVRKAGVGQWAFYACGNPSYGTLGEWSEIQKSGYFIERRAL
jgi:hypothetical protein